MSTQKAWQIWTKMDPAGSSRWQITGSYTTHQRICIWAHYCAAETVQQQLDSVSNWCHNTGSLISPDKAQTFWCKQSSRQTNGNASSHIWWSCGWTNKSSEIPWDPIWQNADLQKTCWNNSTEVQERSVSPESYGCKGYCTMPPLLDVLTWSYGCKGYWTMPPLLAVSKCGAQCHQLRNRPHNNGTYKSAKAGQSAEQGNASHTQNHQGHTQWDHEVHARPPTSANQTEKRCQKSPQPTPQSCKTQMGQAEDSILQACQLTELKQTMKWERYPNQFRNLYEMLLPENLGKHCQECPAGKKQSAIKLLVQENSKLQDIIVCTDGSVSTSHCQARCNYHLWRQCNLHTQPPT